MLPPAMSTGFLASDEHPQTVWMMRPVRPATTNPNLEAIALMTGNHHDSGDGGHSYLLEGTLLIILLNLQECF